MSNLKQKEEKFCYETKMQKLDLRL